MSSFNLAGKVQTVLGPIDPHKLGVTLTHEHLLIDTDGFHHPPESAGARDFYYRPLTLELTGRIRHYHEPNADDNRLLDVDTAIEEVNLYKQHDGDSLVDATSIGLLRDPVGLARISRATGVNVVMGASYYIAATHPEDMDARTEDEIVEHILRDITEGADGTGVRSGVIGEIGCSWPLRDNERKVLRASGRAQRATGAPILIHPGRDESAPLEIIKVLREAGADPGRIIMGHLDRTVFDRAVLKRIAGTGCYLEWDFFGREASFYPENPDIDFPSDARRLDDIAWVIDQGYGCRVVVSHDLAFKHRLTKYGGHGYYYILRHLVPRMRHRGFTPEAIDNILVDNPRDALTFTEPKR